MHVAPPPVTAVEAELATRRQRRRPLRILLLLALAAVVVAIVWGVALYLRHGRANEATPRLTDPVEHFKYGSIGSEVASGIPYWVWQALPRLFPEEFAGRTDYAAFGFLYETGEDGRRLDLPIGVSRREYRGIEMVWFNCAVCHAGTWRPDAAARVPNVVVGMPSNNLDLGRFVRFLLDKAGTDPRLAPETLIAKAEKAGAEFGPVERLLWVHAVAPAVREGLLQRRDRLIPLLDIQPPWGPGRVDTFNPYKVIQLLMSVDELDGHGGMERYGTSDFPSVFLQRPRQGMQLHWDGNNTSLKERNLSAAIGAGVTPATVNHASIERMAEWLLDLQPPPSPLRPAPEAVQAGRAIYMRECVSCHGYQGEDGYVFKGEMLGKVTPLAAIGTDPGRLHSYTPEFRRRQLDEIFEGTPHDFTYFTKTDGYANQPLDGLWLRGPYLHNGSVPTLADLLAPPEERPQAFVRGLDILDYQRGGFLSPACTPRPWNRRDAAGGGLAAQTVAGMEAGDASRASVAGPAGPQVPVREAQGGGAIRGVCFDTALPGNGNGGHTYGTLLPPDQKRALLAYLMTF